MGSTVGSLWALSWDLRDLVPWAGVTPRPPALGVWTHPLDHHEAPVFFNSFIFPIGVTFSTTSPLSVHLETSKPSLVLIACMLRVPWRQGEGGEGGVPSVVEGTTPFALCPCVYVRVLGQWGVCAWEGRTRDRQTGQSECQTCCGLLGSFQNTGPMQSSCGGNPPFVFKWISHDRRHIDNINHSLLEKQSGFLRSGICVTPEVKQ